jgi:bifunctional UDP-N-acetylglucosamine pyrophosphorylase/glucosamine-1-phosphate N-acetyltransferase
MKSSRPKVLHRIAGAPMIDYVLETAAQLRPKSTIVVVGHQAEQLKSALSTRRDLTFVVQEPQGGTAHAVQTAEAALANAAGTLVLLSGDVPLLSQESLKTLVDRHQSTGAAATVMTAVLEQPRGYGRIVRSGERIARIVEDKDASSTEREIHEINSGIYAFALDGLFAALRSVSPDNAQRELYLTDLVAIFTAQGRGVETVTVSNPNEILGINSRAELAAVSRIVRQTKNAELMAAGVTIEDPATTYIDAEVQVGPDTIIHPGVYLEGRTSIGEGCEIHSGARIVDSRIGDHAVILNYCVISYAEIASHAQIGPFAHLRKDARVRERARVGNFVEMKNTTLGAGSKSMHLTYLGDAVIGEHVNVGAGTITCNYDGEKKHPTTIEDGAFIGSDTQLIAPIRVAKTRTWGPVRRFGRTCRPDRWRSAPASSGISKAGSRRRRRTVIEDHICVESSDTSGQKKSSRF